MFREIRRKEKIMEEEIVDYLLENCFYGVLAVVGDNEYGYGIPICYTYHNDSIYFHCSKKGHKIDSIERNNKVSFLVVGQCKNIPEKQDIDFRSAIVFGRAISVEGDEKREAIWKLNDKYSPGYEDDTEDALRRMFEITKVLKIEIEHKTGKMRKGHANYKIVDGKMVHL